MGREVKRVPIDFKWPLNQIWKGYWHPFSSLECKACDGSGQNPEYKKLSDDWYSLGWQYTLTQDEVDKLVEEGRLMDFVNVPINDEQQKVVEEKIKDGGNSWLPYKNGYRPTAEEVNKWAHIGFGHDSINHWICVKQRAKRLGISDAPCEYCNGEGLFFPNDGIAKMSEEWERFGPPDGDAYQLWETTSEGSPISPPFKTPEELASWLAENKASTFGSNTANYETWLNFIRGPGWSPSAIATKKGVQSGVEAIAN